MEKKIKKGGHQVYGEQIEKAERKGGKVSLERGTKRTLGNRQAHRDGGKQTEGTTETRPHGKEKKNERVPRRLRVSRPQTE